MTKDDSILGVRQTEVGAALHFAYPGNFCGQFSHRRKHGLLLLCGGLISIGTEYAVANRSDALCGHCRFLGARAFGASPLGSGCLLRRSLLRRSLLRRSFRRCLRRSRRRRSLRRSHFPLETRSASFDEPTCDNRCMP